MYIPWHDITSIHDSCMYTFHVCSMFLFVEFSISRYLKYNLKLRSVGLHVSSVTFILAKRSSNACDSPVHLRFTWVSDFTFTCNVCMYNYGMRICIWELSCLFKTCLCRHIRPWQGPYIEADLPKGISEENGEWNGRVF